MPQQQGIKKVKIEGISVPEKLASYALAVCGNDRKKLDGWFSWYRTIWKRFPQEDDTEQIRMKKSARVSLFVESITNKLANGFKREEMEKAFAEGDVKLIEEAIKGVYDMNVKFGGIPTPMKYGYFIEILKPLINPHVSFMSLMNRIEMKRPDVFAFIMSSPEKLWWFKECIDYARAFIYFEPAIYMFTKEELGSVVGMGPQGQKEMQAAGEVLQEETGLDLG
ncbi:hypothetical protein MUP59_09445 [Candidatus Bathyarchaeota archaeon]|nr:hypothetical protein [Candidatus Bathyarchaeota archaeon]